MKLKEFSNDMIVFNEDSNMPSKRQDLSITENLEKAISNAEWIFVTFPSFLFESFSKESDTAFA